MATLYETLDSLCRERGIKGGRMCTDLGFSKSLMTDLKSGRKKGINAETAQKIASYFNVTVGYLLGEEDKKEKPVENDGLPDSKKALIDYVISSVPEDKAEKFLKILQSIVEND